MMQKKFIAIFCVLLFFLVDFAQSSSTNKTIATQQIKDLKNGALVVRLKTNDRSIDAYRRAGKKELADKLTEENRIQNQKLTDAFKGSFNFCKVYFIYAKNTNTLLQNKQHIFLNDTLALDTTIKLTEKSFFIAEYGTITSNVRSDEYHYNGVYHTEPSATASSTSVIFISDTSLNQLREPFPFYQPTYLSNYNKAVDNLNRNLEKAYLRLTDTLKEERKKLREQLKKLQ